MVIGIQVVGRVSTALNHFPTVVGGQGVAREAA